MEEWATEEVSTKDLDSAVIAMAKAREDYEVAKAKSNEMHKIYMEQLAKLQDLLTKAGKAKYSVDGLGTVNKVIKYSSRIPQGFTEKKEMIEYFYSLPEEVKVKYLTVNSMSLNSFINEKKEVDESFKVPGVDDPSPREEIRFKRV